MAVPVRHGGADLILIRGVMVRSGTNYLWDLLQQHPDVAAGRAPIWEDFFLHEAVHLHRFVDGLATHWSNEWPIPQPETRLGVLRAIGEGLADYMRADRDHARIVLKTPSPVGVDGVHDLFPRARTILLVRDGRAVVESAMRSFGWSFERAARTWDDGARRILAAASDGDPRVHLVRYEDLLRTPDATLAALLDFLDLDRRGLDPALATALPVRGSSTTRRPGGLPDWSPTTDVRPADMLARGQDWPTARVRRFDWIAGEAMRALGYDLAPHHPRRAVHVALDRLWAVRATARRLARRFVPRRS